MLKNGWLGLFVVSVGLLFWPAEVEAQYCWDCTWTCVMTSSPTEMVTCEDDPEAGGCWYHSGSCGKELFDGMAWAEDLFMSTGIRTVPGAARSLGSLAATSAQIIDVMDFLPFIPSLPSTCGPSRIPLTTVSSITHPISPAVDPNTDKPITVDPT